MQREVGGKVREARMGIEFISTAGGGVATAADFDAIAGELEVGVGWGLRGWGLGMTSAAGIADLSYAQSRAAGVPHLSVDG